MPLSVSVRLGGNVYFAMGKIFSDIHLVVYFKNGDWANLLSLGCFL